jgi:hypothetical protein
MKKKAVTPIGLSKVFGCRQKLTQTVPVDNQCTKLSVWFAAESRLRSLIRKQFSRRSGPFYFPAAR